MLVFHCSTTTHLPLYSFTTLLLGMAPDTVLSALLLFLYYFTTTLLLGITPDTVLSTPDSKKSVQLTSAITKKGELVSEVVDELVVE